MTIKIKKNHIQYINEEYRKMKEEFNHTRKKREQEHKNGD